MYEYDSIYVLTVLLSNDTYFLKDGHKFSKRKLRGGG